MLFGRRRELVSALAIPREERHPCNGCEHEHLDEDVHDEGLEYVILRCHAFSTKRVATIDHSQGLWQDRSVMDTNGRYWQGLFEGSCVLLAR